MMFPKMKTPRDPKYLAWLRKQPCAFCGAAPPSEVSHHGRHGIAIKASDHLALPSCRRCHARHHQGGSPHLRFDNVTPDERRGFFEAMAAKLRERWAVQTR